jgi:OOP family OmpA-OmpF porin
MEERMNRDSFLRKSVIPAAVLICIFCATSVLRAEIKEGSTALSIFFGGFMFDHDLNLDDGLTGGLGIGYNISEHLGAEAVINYVDAKFKHASGLDDKDVSVYLYRLDLLYHLMPESSIVPYLAAGAGGITYDPREKGIDTSTDFMANYGLGLKYFIMPTVALRGDVRHVIGCNECETSNNLLYTIGLAFAFGGKEEAPPPPPPAPPPPAPAPEVKQEVAPPPPAPAPKEEQGAYVFRNIYFDFNKASLKEESLPILDEVVGLLKAKPDMKMEIQGHTDSKGTAAYNLKLSDRRAASVKDYLVKNGIASNRLTIKGYGLTKPVATNATEEGRAKNRRVEFAPIN